MTPLISIIMPCYNNESYVLDTLHCISLQTFIDYEFIIINDGSTDSTLDLLTYYSNFDKRIKIFTIEHTNAGAARNFGIEKASGDYVIFVDSDDLYDRDLLSKMYSKAVLTNADLVVCSYIKFDNNSSKTLWKFVPKNKFLCRSRIRSELVLDDLFSVVPPSPWGKLIKRDVIIENNIKFQSIVSCNDVAFSYTVLSFCKIIAFCPEVLLYYRACIRNNISSKRGDKSENIVLALNELKIRLVNSQKFDILYNTYNELVVRCLKSEFRWCDANKKKYVLKLVKEKIGIDIYDLVSEI